MSATALAQLTELARDWCIEITSTEDGQYRVELSERDKDTGYAITLDCVARYVERDLTVAIARAWAGETPDG